MFPPFHFALKGGEIMEIFTKAMSYVQMGLAAYGGFLVIKGVVTFAGGYSNHQSTEMRDGGAQIFGGALIILSAALVTQIKIG